MPDIAMPDRDEWAVAGVLVDTDVFVDHLRGARRLELDRDVLHYSVITRAELMSGTSATDAIHRFLAPFREHLVDRGVAERAARIRRESGLRRPFVPEAGRRKNCQTVTTIFPT